MSKVWSLLARGSQSTEVLPKLFSIVAYTEDGNGETDIAACNLRWPAQGLQPLEALPSHIVLWDQYLQLPCKDIIWEVSALKTKTDKNVNKTHCGKSQSGSVFGDKDHKQLLFPKVSPFPVSLSSVSLWCSNGWPSPDPVFLFHLFAGSSILTCALGPDWDTDLLGLQADYLWNSMIL